MPLGAPPLAWPALAAYSAGQLNQFHTPSTVVTDRLFRDCFGLGNVSHSWAWPGTTQAQAVQQFADAMDNRQPQSRAAIVHSRWASRWESGTATSGPRSSSSATIP